MREPNVRDAVARATYQGLVKYFRSVDGNTTSATELPPPVTGVQAVSNAAGSVTISWMPPVSNSSAGGAATAYRIYASINGYGFDGGTLVNGGGTTTATLSGYDPTLPYYFKVVAVNAGGESVGSEVVSVLPSGGQKQVLIVNGFDRMIARRTIATQPSPSQHGRPSATTRRRQQHRATTSCKWRRPFTRPGPACTLLSASNEAVISGAVNLTDFDTVDLDTRRRINGRRHVQCHGANQGRAVYRGRRQPLPLRRGDRAGTSTPRAAACRSSRTTLKGNYVSAAVDFGRRWPGSGRATDRPADRQDRLHLRRSRHRVRGGSTNGGWLTDRPEYSEIVEDFGNQDQLTPLPTTSFRAGATVVPMRPSAISSTKSCSTTTRPASPTPARGATARRHPLVRRRLRRRRRLGPLSLRQHIDRRRNGGRDLHAEHSRGRLLSRLYVGRSAGTNRTSQLYKVNHTGGQTQIRVDHSMVGNGWVYLGTYHFDGGSSAVEGSVQISNQGAGGKVVIADAMRFGNGMGDLQVASAASAREPFRAIRARTRDSFYWLYRGIGLGITPTSVLENQQCVGAVENGEHMNQNTNPFGTSVYIGFHRTRDPDRTARGAVGLIDSDAATPPTSDLALFTGRQINQDMQALNGTFEHNWSTRTSHTCSGGFGEIDLGLSAEMDATIIEVGFHDNTQDCRSSCAIRRCATEWPLDLRSDALEYFDALAAPNDHRRCPLPPASVRAVSNAAGEVTLTWAAGPTGACRVSAPRRPATASTPRSTATASTAARSSPAAARPRRR